MYTTDGLVNGSLYVHTEDYNKWLIISVPNESKNMATLITRIGGVEESPWTLDPKKDYAAIQDYINAIKTGIWLYVGNINTILRTAAALANEVEDA